jgi:AraC-like DNA-binding protein
MERVIETTDLDATRAALGNAYASMRMTVIGPQHGMRLASTAAGGVRFDRLRFGMAFDADVAPVGSHVFAHLHSGRIEHETPDERSAYGPGDVFLAATTAKPYATRVVDSVLETAVVRPEFVDDVAQTTARHRPVRFLDHAPLAPAAAEQWRSTFRFVRDHVAARPGADRHPLVVANAVRLLASTALAVFPNDALSEPGAQDRSDAHSGTLRRAMAFIESHPDRPLTAADIARAAHVTPRAVQLAFRVHLGTTPMTYLRRVRLDRAHAELRDAEPGGTSVTEIAARWGFLRPGRFATEYRAVYGRHPGTTLRDGTDRPA